VFAVVAVMIAFAIVRNLPSMNSLRP
jgi:hypothetical protein